METVTPGALLSSIRHPLTTVKILIFTVHFDNRSLQLKSHTSMAYLANYYLDFLSANTGTH